MAAASGMASSSIPCGLLPLLSEHPCRPRLVSDLPVAFLWSSIWIFDAAWDSANTVLAAALLELRMRRRRVLGESEAEAVACLGGADDSGGALPELLVAGGGQPTDRAVYHVDRARVVDGRDVFEGDADGEVGGAVVVEVAGRQRPAECVACLGGAGESRGALPELLVVGGGQATG